MTIATIPPVLSLTGLQGITIDTSQEAKAQRDSLLTLAKEVTAVTSAEEARIAAEVLKSLKSFTRTIEDTRSMVKAPVLELGKKVDGIAKEMTFALETEATRISRTIGTYQAEQQRKEEEARRKAREEEQRIIEETNRKLREAEEASKTEASFAKKAEKIETKAFEQIAETRAAVVVAEKPTGLATRTEVCFEVEDVVALYEANPAFVILSPNNAALKAALKALPADKHIPGVRHWREARSFVR